MDAEALRAAVGALVGRHEVLRSRLATIEGVAVQLVDPPGDRVVELTDLSGEADPWGQAEALVAAAAARPFDLARGPLFRAQLVRLGPDDHVLSLVMHHVVTDEWSMGVLWQDLDQLYEAFRDGRESPLAPLPVQYADFAAWQRRWLQGEVLEGQLAYWRSQLEDAALLELPTDRPRPAVRSSAGATFEFVVPPETVQGLRAVGRQGAATMFMTLLAGFDVLLGHYAAQDDVVVGTPIANRNRAETEGLIGFFLNTMVMRTDLSGDPRLAEVVDRVRETALAAYAHQDMPFEQLVDALQPERDRSRTPLFQVLFDYIQRDSAEPTLGGDVVLSEFGGGPVDAQFDLRLMFVDEGDGALGGAVEYSTELFDQATVERMLDHLVTVLGVMATDPQRRISELSVLSAGERHQLVDEWNDTAGDVPSGLLSDLVAAPATRDPAAVALASGSTPLSYDELARRTNRLAHYLRAQGVGPEVVVGVCLPRSADLVVTLLAVLQAGGAYLPLDPSFPLARLGFMLGDSRAALLLGETATVDDLPLTATRAVALDDPATQAALAGQPTETPDTVASADQLAYLMYTSGSTGQPKGVQVTRGGLANYLAWCVEAYEVAAGGGAPLHSSVAFDLTVTSVFAPLLAGVPVELVPDEPGTDALVQALQASGPFSFVKLTPAHLALLADTLSDEEIAGTARRLIVGGEALGAADVTAWLDRAPGSSIVNEYGPTETVVGCCVHEIHPGDDLAAGVPIGRPIANTRLHVLDRHLGLAPVGVPGELYIGGTGVARGYAHRPALTAERFVADPCAGDGRRLYRSGDRVTRRPDGNLVFHGRGDDQLKIRGYRIEPAEIESRLLAHPSIGGTVVVARSLPTTAERQLVAYVVPADPEAGTPTTTELRGWVGEALPAYMVPSSFVELAALPLSPNGKVDRAALPEPEGERPSLAAGYVAPRSPVEALLAPVWAEVLGLDEVGVDDNFFELGGDSILSIQVVARARRSGVQLSPADLFEHQTVASLALVARREAATDAEQGLVVGEAALVPIQRWFFERSLPDAHHFNQSFLLELTERIDPDLLRRALVALVEHHDGLRSRFVPRDDGWTAVVDETLADEVFSVVDVAHLRGAARASRLEAVGRTTQQSLDLATGPLVRFVLFELGQAGQLLLLVAHHLVVDAVSWRILLEDLTALCEHLERGEEVGLPAKTTSFRRWAERLHELATSDETAREADYWQATTPAAAARLPRDRHGDNTMASAAVVEVALEAASTTRLLQEVPGAYRTRINDVLLAALGVAVGEWTGTAQVPLDLEGHGREDVGPAIDVTRTVGWFTTLFPVVVGVEGGLDDPGHLLKTTKEQLRRVPRRGLGYGLLRYLAGDGPGGALAGASPAELSFNYLGQFDQVAVVERERFHAAEGTLGVEVALSGPRSHLLEVTGLVQDGRLQLAWTYSEEVHDRATVEAVARRHVEVLDLLIEHCCRPGVGGHTPSDFPLAELDQSTVDLIQSRFAQLQGAGDDDERSS